MVKTHITACGVDKTIPNNHPSHVSCDNRPQACDTGPFDLEKRAGITGSRGCDSILVWILLLNKSKSQEIIFRKPRSRDTTDVSIIPGIQRVNSLKIIGVTLCSNFSMQEHVSSVISSSAQSVYALRVLRSHGFDDQSLQTVFQATVISKLHYASSAWWGFTNAAQRNQLESFLRRAVKVGFHKNNSQTLSAICEAADEKLFRKVKVKTGYLYSGIVSLTATGGCRLFCSALPVRSA